MKIADQNASDFLYGFRCCSDVRSEKAGDRASLPVLPLGFWRAWSVDFKDRAVGGSKGRKIRLLHYLFKTERLERRYGTSV